MKRRNAVQLVMWSLAATAGCSGDHAAGPSTPACSSALASPVVLAVGAYSSIDPASDAGCVTVAANASAVDSAEYLLVPQSASGTPGASSPFRLQVASLHPTAPLAAAATAPASSGQRSTAVEFDRFLRHAAASRRYEAPPSAGPRLGRAPALQVAPPTPGSLRTFKVCGNLTCSTSAFKTVGARVQSLGTHIAIYVDTLAPANGLTTADFDTLRTVFDSRLYPLDTAAFGREPDVDSNGVVIVLMTGVVNALVTKTQCGTTGYVAGFFFPALPGSPRRATDHHRGSLARHPDRRTHGRPRRFRRMIPKVNCG